MLWIKSTFAAVCTSYSVSSIAIIRLTGPKSYYIAQLLVKNNLKSSYINFSAIINYKKYFLDDAIVLFFRRPYSYTGEDTIEFHIHGGSLIIKQLLISVFRFGARLAEPGEFTKLAYYNKKINILKVQLIFNSIFSQKRTLIVFYQNIIYKQYFISFYRIIKKLKHIYLSLENSIYFFSFTLPNYLLIEWKIEIKNIIYKLKQFNLSTNNLIQQDNNKFLRIIFIGWPNVGKSSLFNCFLNKKKALVSSIEGTTRDLIYSDYEDDTKTIFIDTVGLRFYDSYIELKGLKRSLFLLQDNCNIFLCFSFINEIQISLPEMLWPLLELYSSKIYCIFNKIDIFLNDISFINYKLFFYVSARFNIGINNIKKNILLLTLINTLDIFFNSNIIIEKSILHLSRALNNLNNGFFDMIAEDVKQSFSSLEKIFRETNTSILDSIFSKFCIGK